MTWRFSRAVACLVVCLAGRLIYVAPACAQAPVASRDDVEEALEQVLGFEARRPFTLYQRVEMSSSSRGHVLDLNTTLGYDISRHFSVDAGLPVYLVRTYSTIPRVNQTGGAGSGIGNIYGALHFWLVGSAVDYSATLTLAAPTGNKKDGRSTGHFTYDWTNHLERSLGRFTPFAEAGLANTVADTRFFMRQFTTFGHAAHVEAGTRIRLSRSFTLSASLYDVLPWGPQTLFTRKIRVRTRDGKQYFRTRTLVVGGPELSRDNGVSLALASRLGRNVDLGVAYTRSTHLHLNIVSVSLGYDLGSLLKRSRHQ